MKRCTGYFLRVAFVTFMLLPCGCGSQQTSLGSKTDPAVKRINEKLDSPDPAVRKQGADEAGGKFGGDKAR